MSHPLLSTAPAAPRLGPLRLHAQVSRWPLKEPFRITGQTYTFKDFLEVRLEMDGVSGHGEGAGVRYLGDTPDRMLDHVEQVRAVVERGLSRDTLRQLLPPSGARNALDCALWDLEAKLVGQAVWRLAGLPAPQPRLTMFTCGADTPDRMAATARALDHSQAIKLKLTGEAEDGARVEAVRAAREEVWLSIDANQGFTRGHLEALMPVLVACEVALIEQPFPIGCEAWLDGLCSPIPVAADESAQSLADLPGLRGRFDIVNIKLDKCGGLTEGLEIARRAPMLGLRTMVGNMFGTSLAMAPAYLLAQVCDYADVDGPTFLVSDRTPALRFAAGRVDDPHGVWGDHAGR